MNYKIARRLYQALEAKYTAEIMDARARLSVYFESSVGIGEHPQHTEEMDGLVEQLANATDKLETLSSNFSKEYGSDIPTTHESYSRPCQIKDEGELLKG